MAAFTRATMKVTPQTPVTEARGKVSGFATCEMPRDPHVNPPSGHIPRIQSTAVQAAATTKAFAIGLSSRRARTTSNAKSAADAAHSRTSAVHASAPNSAIRIERRAVQADP